MKTKTKKSRGLVICVLPSRLYFTRKHTKTDSASKTLLFSHTRPRDPAVPHPATPFSFLRPPEAIPSPKKPKVPPHFFKSFLRSCLKKEGGGPWVLPHPKEGKTADRKNEKKSGRLFSLPEPFFFARGMDLNSNINDDKKM